MCAQVGMCKYNFLLCKVLYLILNSVNSEVDIIEIKPDLKKKQGLGDF